MPAARKLMRQIREVLRLKWELGFSNRRIARGCGLSRPTVAKYVRRAEAAGLTWPLPEDLDDGALESQLFPPEPLPAAARPVPEWSVMHRELKGKGVTLALLWDEYKAVNPEGFQYSWFCAHYRRWLDKLDVVMRQMHRAGEKLFVDYAGHTAQVIDRHTRGVMETISLKGLYASIPDFMSDTRLGFGHKSDVDKTIALEAGWGRKEAREYLEQVRYKDGICHLCRGIPSTSSHMGYAGRFLNIYRPYVMSEAIRSGVSCRDAENRVRERLGMPHIGEAWVSETHL